MSCRDFALLIEIDCQVEDEQIRQRVWSRNVGRSRSGLALSTRQCTYLATAQTGEVSNLHGLTKQTLSVAGSSLQLQVRVQEALFVHIHF